MLSTVVFERPNHRTAMALFNVSNLTDTTDPACVILDPVNQADLIVRLHLSHSWISALTVMPSIRRVNDKIPTSPLLQPGGCLRAFRDYLPNSQIFGADYDREVLLEEPRIRTTFVDHMHLHLLPRPQCLLLGGTVCREACLLPLSSISGVPTPFVCRAQHS